MEAVIVRGAIREAAVRPAAGHPRREAAVGVVAAVVTRSVRRAADFAAQSDDPSGPAHQESFLARGQNSPILGVNTNRPFEFCLGVQTFLVAVASLTSPNARSILVCGWLRSLAALFPCEPRSNTNLLSDGATWDDVMYRNHVRQKIEAGLRDIENGATLTTGDVRKRFELSDSASQ